MMNTRSRTARGLALAVVAAAALGTSACNKQGNTLPGGMGQQDNGQQGGGQLKTYDKDAFIQAASKANSGDYSAKMHMKMGMDMSQLQRQMGSGSSSMPSGMPSTMDITADGKVSTRGGKPSADMTMSMMGKDIDMKLVDDKVYMKSSSLTGNKWMVQSAGTGSSGSSDPSQMMSQMTKSIKDLKFVGTEDVNGEKMNHYKVTTSPDTSALGSSAGAGMPSTIDMDMWMDANDHVRKASGGASGMTMEITLDDFGAPIDVQAPPSSEVSSRSGLGSSTGSGVSL